MLQFGILGPLEVRRDGRPIAVAGDKLRAVLAVLLVNANQAVSGDRLALALWGDDAPANAVRTVQVHVSRLRRVLASDGLLKTTPAGYVLPSDEQTLDAARFERLVADAGEADPERAWELINRALELWRGEPLADVDPRDFAHAEIVRLQELRLVALELRAQAAIALDHTPDALADLQRLAVEHPGREGFTRLLMLALYRAGRHAEALDAFARTRAYLTDELGLETSPELRALQQAVLTHGVAVPVAPAAPPVPARPLIGRERECRELIALIERDDVRVLTIVGPGGAGKTRLALEVAGRARSRCVWVELSGLIRAQDVPEAIVRTLGLETVSGEAPDETLVRSLATENLLLVLDNMEHVLAAADALGRLVAAVAGVTVLVTSRERLGLTAERSYPIAALEQEDAVALLCDAAARQGCRWAPDATAAEICDRLDRLPLAIELAAARAELFTPAQLAARLDNGLGALGRGQRDAVDRHQTLRATVEWSYGLLDAGEREAFAAFAAFADGAELEAAEAITGASWDALQGLLAKHLLYRGPDGRLAMLNTIRSLAVEHAGEAPRQRHFEYYLALAENARPHLFTRAEDAWLRQLDVERNNLRAALEWGVHHAASRALRLAAALQRYFAIRGPEEEAERWLERALLAAGHHAPAPDRADATIELAHSRIGQSKSAASSARRALELAASTGDHALQARAHHALAVHLTVGGDPRGSLPHAESALRHARFTGDPVLLGDAHRLMATALAPDAAHPHMVAAVAHFAAVGNPWHEALLYSDLAYTALTEARYADALELLERAMALVDDSHPRVQMLILGNVGLARLFNGDIAGAREAFNTELKLTAARPNAELASEALGGLAAVASALDSPDRCAVLLGCALEAGTIADGVLRAALEHRFYRRSREALGADAWQHLQRLGRELTLDEAAKFEAGALVARR